MDQIVVVHWQQKKLPKHFCASAFKKKIPLRAFKTKIIIKADVNARVN